METVSLGVQLSRHVGLPDDQHRRATFDLGHGREPRSAAIELERRARYRVVFASIGGLIGLACWLAASRSCRPCVRPRRRLLLHSIEAARKRDYAIHSEEIDLGADAMNGRRRGSRRGAYPRRERQAVFIASADVDVARYLGRSHTTSSRLDDGEASSTSPRRKATNPPGNKFLVAENEGSGEQALTWDADLVAGPSWP